ncbi:MAG: amidase family protein [Terriglobia bacterium]
MFKQYSDGLEAMTQAGVGPADPLRAPLREARERHKTAISPFLARARRRLPGPDTVFAGGQERSPLGALSWFTRVFNVTGSPAITVACGFSTRGLPIGLQFAGPARDEALVLRAAFAYKQATDWRRNRPNVGVGITAPPAAGNPG